MKMKTRTDITALDNATLTERLDAMQESTRDAFSDRLRSARAAFEARLVQHVEHRLTQALDAVMRE
jgi:hypothetical protein